MQRLTINFWRIVLTLAIACLSSSVSAHPGSGIAVDRLGQVYFLDTGSGLWKIDAKGRLIHLSSKLFHWLALDAKDRFADAQLPSNAGTGLDWEILKVGVNPTVLIASDFPIAMSQDGNLYFPSGRSGDLRIMRAMAGGTTSVLVKLPATVKDEPLPNINGITTGPNGSVYYTENSAIRRITAQGVISTFATVRNPSSMPSIPATDQHPYLRGLAVDTRGAVYVADTGNARVLKITPDEKATTLHQTESPWSPTDVALFGDHVYVLEFLHTAQDVRRDWLPRVRKITAEGKSTIIATVDQMPGAR